MQMGRVVIVGPHGRKLGGPVLQTICDSSDIRAIAGIVSQKDSNPLSGCVLCRSFGDIPNLPSGDERGDIVVFYAVKADALQERLAEAVENGFTRHVIGTTAIFDTTLVLIAKLSLHGHTFLVAPNFSAGANRGAEQCARFARDMPDAEVEIIEMHHSRKSDAPSGTALLWARAVAAARGQGLRDILKLGRHGSGLRTQEEICIHSVRLGNVTGRHEAFFASGQEIVSVKHEAESSALFAENAVNGIRWILDEVRFSGVYYMYDVLGLDLLHELSVS